MKLKVAIRTEVNEKKIEAEFICIDLKINQYMLDVDAHDNIKRQSGF
jgi:hypothetical protein